MNTPYPEAADAAFVKRHGLSLWLPAAFLAALFVNAGAGLYLWLSAGLGAASIASVAVWAGWGALAVAAAITLRR